MQRALQIRPAPIPADIARAISAQPVRSVVVPNGAEWREMAAFGVVLQRC
jgi:hypothetical protein